MNEDIVFVCVSVGCIYGSFSVEVVYEESVMKYGEDGGSFWV